MSEADAPASRETTVDREELPLAVTFDIEPVRLAPLYRVGLLIVCLTMLLLPLVYLALIGLMGYGVWFHATHSHVILAGGGGTGRIIVYFGPIVAGVLAVLFMIKPLFAPKLEGMPPRTLRRDEQPLLHAFVEALCASLGAPAPRRIDVDMQVNASASFRRGMVSFMDSDLVLTLGLPLTAGMSLGQLSGVLAHEFGHFTQGAAMRSSYIIGSVNHWFARVVYERDAWDARLERWSAESVTGWSSLILAISRAFIWLSRRALWVLMMIGVAVSGFLSRQMEYNADLHQARISGSDLFRATHMRLPLLSAAWSQTAAYLGEMWRERRLVDDVVELFLVEVRRLTTSPDVVEQVEASVRDVRTGVLDTHPSTVDRIRAVEEGDHPVRVDDPRPASDLIAGFEDLCKELTETFYEGALGERIDPRNLVPTVDAIVEQEGRIEGNKALTRYFQETPLIWMGLAPDRTADASPSLEEAAARIRASRRRMEEEAPQVRERFEHVDSLAQARLAAALYVRSLDAGIPEKEAPRLDALRLGDGEDPDEHLDELHAELRRTRSAMAPHLDVARERIGTALGVCDHPRISSGLSCGETIVGRLPKLTAAISMIVSEWPSLRRIGQLVPELGTLLQAAGSRMDTAPMVQEVERVSTELQRLVAALRGPLAAVEYPYDHGEGRITVAAYAFPDRDDGETHVIHVAARALENVNQLYGRIWSDLAALALEVEDALGASEGGAVSGSEPREQAAPGSGTSDGEASGDGAGEPA